MNSAVYTTSERDDLIPLAQTGFFSSRENLSAEKTFLHNLNALLQSTSPLRFDEKILAQKRSQYFEAKKDRMDTEELNGQLVVVYEQLTRDNRLALITGPPGAAKTTVAALWVKLARELNPGTPVVLMTQEKPALHRLHEKLGFQEAVLVVLEDFIAHARPLPDKAIVIIDEVGLLGTQTMAQVFEKLNSDNPVKILLIGDDKQLMPTDAGQPFRWMRETKKAPVSELLFPYRQKNPILRQAVQDLYCGDVLKAFEKINPRFAEHDELIADARAIINDFAPEKSMVLVHGDAFVQERLKVLCPGFRIYSLAAAQGLAVDQALLILAGPINLSECLVGMSRARHDVTILIDASVYADRDHFLSTQRSYPKNLMALDVIGENGLLQVLDQA